MISQILNREFVLQQMADVQAHLSEGRRAAGEQPPGAEDLSGADFDQALEELSAALEREQQASSGQPAFEPPPSERRGETPVPIDDTAFLSRDPIVSNLQAALELYFLEGPGARDTDQAAIEAPLGEGRRGEALPAVTNVSLPGEGLPRDAEGRRLFNRFSVTDIGWVSSAVAMGVRLFRKRHAFVDRPPEPIPISDKARLILVADWGSGIPRAVAVANQMRTVIEQGKAAGLEQHVLHLGDVYYSGWEYEYRRRFLPYWPVKPEEADSIGSYCLNGNHDMYSGGFAYYDCALTDPRFKRQQGSSYFALWNKNWNILGLDSAWDDGGLKDPQGDWAKAHATSGKKNILLTHHQPLSIFESASPEMAGKLSALTSAGLVNSWFFGHEHRCVVYAPDQQAKIQSARLIGHGGTPVYMTHKGPLPPQVKYELRDYIDEGLEHWTLFGFAVLDFDGAQIQARYIDESGNTNYTECLG